MTTSATNYATITADLPDWASDTIDFKLLSSVAISTLEIFPGKVYTMTLDVNGAGTTDLPTPDGDGTLAWLWEVSFPDSREVNISFAWAAVDQDLATLLTAEQSDTTPSDVATLIANKANKITGGTEGNLTSITAGGDIQDAGVAVADIGGIGWLGVSSYWTSGVITDPAIAGRFVTDAGSLVQFTTKININEESYSGSGFNYQIRTLKSGDLISFAESESAIATFELTADVVSTPTTMTLNVAFRWTDFLNWTNIAYDIEFTRATVYSAADFSAAPTTDEPLKAGGSGGIAFGGDVDFAGNYLENVVDRPEVLAATISGTVHTIDHTVARMFVFTLANSPTITLSIADTPLDGDSYILRLVQDAIGSRVVTWANVAWGNAGEPTLETTPNGYDYITFIYNSVTLLWDGIHGGAWT